MISIRNTVQKRFKIINNLILITNKRNHSSSNETIIEITKKIDFYDIVICGGGMVGTAMARSLGTNNVFKNLKIALIESSNKYEYKKQEIHSNRVCALNETTINLFKCKYIYLLVLLTAIANLKSSRSSRILIKIHVIHLF